MAPRETKADSNKAYFRIGEVASLVGVEPHVLRYWEREFRAIRPTKSTNGQRVYSRVDVDKLKQVRDLLYNERFTIEGAKKKLAKVEPAPATPHAAPVAALPMRDELLAIRLEIDAFLEHLDALD